MTGLTAKGLDALGLAMPAIPDQRMHVCIGDAKVGTRSVGTGEVLGVHTFRGSSAAFDLAPGTHRQMRWPSTQRGSGGETTGGAIVWGAGLEVSVERVALGPSS